jgi:hypothetical protein
MKYYAIIFDEKLLIRVISQWGLNEPFNGSYHAPALHKIRGDMGFSLKCYGTTDFGVRLLYLFSDFIE